MYEAFYQLTEQPFSFTPDPRFLYQSEKHKEAFAHLVYGIRERSGFIMITGEIGTGKTTICRTLLKQLDPNTEMAYIFNPSLSPEELLRKINQEFGIDSKAPTMEELNNVLNEHLIDRNVQGKNCALVIDEAQNLTPSVLEQIRLLSNLETEAQKLIQIVLIGQPELLEHLQLTQLRQLNQRIVARYHLTELDRKETEEYVAHRLAVAGGKDSVHFTPGALRAVYRFSGGTPRVINTICDRSLLVGYTMEAKEITASIVDLAAKEVRGEPSKSRKGLTERLVDLWFALYTLAEQGRSLPRFVLVMAAMILLVFTVVLIAAWHSSSPNEPLPSPQTQGAQPDIQAPVPPPDVVADDRATEERITEALGIVSPNPAAAFVSGHDVPSAVMLPEPSGMEPFETMNQVVLRNNALAAVLGYYGRLVQSAFPIDDSAESLANFAAANGLVCEWITPVLDELTLIGLPALTRIKKGTNGNGTLWVGLMGVEADQFRLVTDTSETVLVDRDDFRAVYVNEAVILWHDREPDFPVLARPMRGPYVNRLQKWLLLIDRLPRPLSGVYDDETARAVAKIQAQTGLPINGVVNRQMRMVLDSWLPVFPQQIVNMDPEAARKNVLEEILGVWQAGTPERYPGGDSPQSLANLARSMGLESQILRPELDEILAIGLPVLARVTSGDKTRWVGLLGAEDGKVRLVTDLDGTLLVNKSEFEEMFAHEAVVLSRDPNPGARSLVGGMKGPEVEKLQQDLVKLGRLSSPISGMYDDGTVRAVAKIQAETGIKIDGKVGPQTRMVLNSWLRERAVPEPVVAPPLPVVPTPKPPPPATPRANPVPPDPVVSEPNVKTADLPAVAGEDSLGLPKVPVPKEVTPPATDSMPVLPPQGSTAVPPPAENP